MTIRQIRRGVFETNSSSTHSISIEYDNHFSDLLKVEDGVVKSSLQKLQDC